MLLAHVGLPRSGKSYSACVDHILPALTSGRRVFTNIAGINHQKFADLANMTEEECRELLIQLKPEDLNHENLPKLWKRFPSGKEVQDDYGEIIEGSLLQDSILVFDEIQDIYPSARQKLPDSVMQFIAQHGHYGMDILIMSQEFSSIHKEWRVRCQRMYTFVKMTAVGMETRFKWELHEGQGNQKFQKISSGVKKYDPLYFGLYRSHVDGTENKGNLQDARVNIFGGRIFRFYLPLMFAASVVGVIFLYRFFHSPLGKTQASTVQTQAVTTPAPKPSSKPEPETETPKVVHQEPAPPVDYFDEIAKPNRVRLSGVIRTPSLEKAFIQIIDKMGHDVESFTSEELRGMGWTVKVETWGVVISQGSARHIARPWPRDHFGIVPRDSATHAALTQ